MSADFEARIAYSRDEVAALVGLSPSSVQKAHYAGDLVGSKVGGRWLFTRADIDRWLASKRRGFVAEPTRLRAVGHP